MSHFLLGGEDDAVRAWRSGFIAGYRAANVADHILFLGAGERRAGTPRQLLLFIFFSPAQISPYNPSHRRRFS
jgi:hypothetical protein